MKKLYKTRLLKLVEHLEKPDWERFHEQFDFSIITDGRFDEDHNYCGTAGCALGELPAVFPKHWLFEPGFVESVRLRRGSFNNTIQDAKVFFGLDTFASYHLFHPSRQDTGKYGGKRLDGSATAKQVARNIREFLKRCQ